MIRYLIFFTSLLASSASSLAQTATEPANELNSVPPTLSSTTSEPIITKPAATEISVKPLRKVSYGLTAGTQFSRLLGTVTYLEPSVLVPVTKRLSGFASLSLITTFNANRNLVGNADLYAANNALLRNQRYILNAGGHYLVNDRLSLTGSVWRDLSRNPLPHQVNLLMPGGTNGMSFRANYKITDNISVSGGVRYSNGNAYQNNWYNLASPYGY